MEEIFTNIILNVEIFFVVENNKFISKVNAIENKITRPTLLHSNECHFHSTNPNELILVRIDR